MTIQEVMKRYFDWMVNFVIVPSPSGGSMIPLRLGYRYNHSLLLDFLNKMDFIVPVDFGSVDVDRVRDATSMRVEFLLDLKTEGVDCGELSDQMVLPSSVSVLEILVAFARKIESCVMGDSEKGDRTGVWFWTMIYNLKLINISDEAFQSTRGITRWTIQDIVNRWMMREYHVLGDGSLFPLRNQMVNQQKLSMWSQMLSYMCDGSLRGEF